MDDNTPVPEAITNFDFLPTWWQELIDYGINPHQRMGIYMGLYAVLGAELGSFVTTNYGENSYHTTFQTFIVGKAASGKGFVGWLRKIIEPKHARQMKAYEQAKAAYDKERAAYDIAGKERANLEAPVEPIRKLFHIPANNSGTGILENLANSMGEGIILESEADTLSTALNTDYGQWYEPRLGKKDPATAQGSGVRPIDTPI